MRGLVAGVGTVLALLALHGTARAGAPAEVTATATVWPDGGGWTEAVVTVRTGAEPWAGEVGLASRTAALRVRVELPARARRVLTLPLWVDAGSVPPRVRAGGRAVGDVTFVAPTGARTLTLDAAGPVPPLPRTPAGYESLDVLVLRADAARALEPERAGALERWIAGGGILGVVDADAGVPMSERRVGDGLVVVGRSAAEMRPALDRHARARRAPAAATIARAWEREAPAARIPGARDSRPGVPQALAVAVYVGLLGALAALADRSAALRRRGLALGLLLVGGGALGTWSVGRAGGGAGVDVEQVTLVQSRADGTARARAVVSVRASRATLARFATPEGAAVREVLAPRAAARPDRAVRWDPVRAVWERELALGESVSVRVDAPVADPGVRAAREPGGAWSIANTGSRTLRDPILLRGGQPAVRLGDLGPGARTVVAGTAAPPAHVSAEAALGFWRPFLPAGIPGDARPTLLATVEPPLEVADFGRAARHGPARTHLVATLSPGDDRR